MNIKVIGYIELSFTVLIFIGVMLLSLKKWHSLQKKENCNNKTSIRLNKTLIMLMHIGSIALFLIAFISLFSICKQSNSAQNKENFAYVQFILLFFWASALYLSHIVSWEICVYSDKLVYTGIFGIKHTYHYDEFKVRMIHTGYAYYRKGRCFFSTASKLQNAEVLTMTINLYKNKEIFVLPMKQGDIDIEALRREEREWLKTASDNDKTLYEGLIENLKKENDEVFVADYISEAQDKTIFSIFENTLLSWEDKKMQALVAYIIGDKENKNAYGIILKAYLSLSWEDKKRYASLYDKAIRSTITREPLLLDKGWLADWHSAFNLPNTMKKIAKGNLPGINEIWLGILKQKNTYDREWYDLEDAKATLLPLVRR